MQDPYRKRLIRRTRRILWGRVEVIAAVVGLLVIASRPLMDWVLSIWEGFPWWVGVLILILLISYALVRSGYELWNEAEEEHKKTREKLRVSQQEREKLQKELEEVGAKGGNGPRYDRFLAELERVRAERDKLGKELTARFAYEPLRDWHLKNEAKWEYIREANLTEIKELKQRCLELADELYQFLEERGHEEMDDLQDPEVQRRSNETVELYREHFTEKVNGLREDLEQCKLWGLGVIDLHERDMVENPTNYLSVRAIAGYLSSIGNKL